MSRVLSGIQPSGTLHIGNYFGMMNQMISLQDSNELYCFIVNYHALTSLQNPKELSTNTLNAAMDFLSLGLNPDKCFFWVQSDIPEVQELSWILACHTAMGFMDRSHSYKDKIAKGIIPNIGLFTYPVLMAADILLFQSEIVPVGKDQKQHLEITRDIAQHFNNIYGETFVIPEAKIEKEIAVIPGIDGQKMSKSYGNTIGIFEEEKALRKKVMSIKTDSTPVELPKDPDTCNVFALHKLFSSEQQSSDLRNRYLSGGLGYGTAKSELFELVRDHFKPYKEKRNEMAGNPDSVRKILKNGAEKTREKAMITMKLVRDRVGINY